MSERLARIKMLAMDVDGTLTDGSMVFTNGSQVKVFHAHDGLGIRLAINFGLEIAWITGNVSMAVVERARTLGVEDLYQRVRYKTEALEDIVANHDFGADEIAFMGDDLNDLPAFEYVGYAFAPADAVEEARARADTVTTRAGGRGAVREAIEMILKARGEWDRAVASFLEELKAEEAGKAGPEAVA